ncbi:Halotolerance protein 9 [Paramyrothecium foliicola]|nr:Halotolerance protein 9 [Paramyrothecium foliicola]
MAVATFSTSNPSLEPWEYCIPGAAPFSDTRPMTSGVMSYQYPLLSSEHGPLDGSQAPYPMAFDVSHQEMQANSMISRNASRVSLNGVADPSLSTRRSFSTPTSSTQQDSASDQGAQTGANGEKKRTKLGYHRTSIACSHCRRRKIRCVTSPDVPNKCTNCIRLKKVCSFCPVDQQAAGETRPKMSSRNSNGHKNGSASSPSSMTDGNIDGGSFSDMAMSGGMSSTDEGLSPQSKEEGSSESLPRQAYVPGNASMAGWMPGVGNNGLVNQNDPNAAWRQYPGEANVNAQFPAYSQAPSGPAAWASNTSDAMARDDANWVAFPTPARPISYTEGALNNQQQLSYMGHAHGSTVQRGPSGFPNVYHQLGQNVDESAATALAGPNGASMAAMPPTEHSSWRHDHPANINPHLPHATMTEAYDQWSYDNSGGEQLMHVTGSEQKIPSSTVGSHGHAYYPPNV